MVAECPPPRGAQPEAAVIFAGTRQQGARSSWRNMLTKLVVVRNDTSRALMSSEIYSEELKEVALERGNHIYLVALGPRVRVIAVDDTDGTDGTWIVRTEFENGGLWKPRTVRVPRQLLGGGELRHVKDHVVHRSSEGIEKKYAAISLVRALLRANFASAAERERFWYEHTIKKFFTYSIVYVGQAYGRDKRRSAIDRIEQGHEHLQKILAEVHDYHPDQHVGVMIADLRLAGAEVHGSIGPKTLEQIATASEDLLTNFGGALEDPKNALDAVEALLIRYFQPVENTKLKQFPRYGLPSLIRKLETSYITHLGIDFNVADSYALLWDPKRAKARSVHRFSVNIRTGRPEAAGNAPLSWQPDA
ncbi:hypothetical protein [Egicoccus sp. AB-alg6-2]|uniref:hypothetical protein n=1 Tax=Egicoccus sp. AB-alg6-2 TaxID=3242692 RepID=UPI00359CEC91